MTGPVSPASDLGSPVTQRGRLQKGRRDTARCVWTQLTADNGKTYVLPQEGAEANHTLVVSTRPSVPTILDPVHVEL